jgi:hypothetical protein
MEFALCLRQYILPSNCLNVAWFHIVIQYSTVDQFSGESNPVILPLDEDEVSFTSNLPQTLTLLVIPNILQSPFMQSCIFKQMILGLKQVLTGMKIGGILSLFSSHAFRIYLK